MEHMLSILAEIKQISDNLLNDDDSPLVAGEQTVFTQIIYDRAKSLYEALEPVIIALKARQTGDPFPGDMHNLRTPLVSIIGYSDLLADGMIDEVNEAQSTQYARIHALGSTLHETLEKTDETIRTELQDSQI